VSWDALTAIGTVFTSLVIVVTAVIGMGQLRQFRAQRRDVAAVELVRSLQDDSYLEAYRRIFSVAYKDRANPPSEAIDYDKAAVTLAFRFEMLGVLVYRGTIPFDIAEDLVGGLVVLTWRRLRDATLENRVTLGWPTYMEWFQWLAEQLERRERLDQTPAHIREAAWRPV
jgi:hypothetical protein